MTGQPRAIRLLYTFQDRYVAAAIRNGICVTICSSLPVVPDHPVSQGLIFPQQDERTLLIYSHHWNRVCTRKFFAKASEAVRRKERLFDLRVLTVPPVGPSGFLRYLEKNGALLVGPHIVLSFLRAAGPRHLELQEVSEEDALGREIVSSIRHGDDGGFLPDAAMMEPLIPWLSA